MKKHWKVAIGALISLTIISGILLYFVLTEVGAFFDKTYEPIESTPQEETASVVKTEHKKEKETGVLHVLLMGVDERINDKGRTDVLMVLEVNPNDKSTKIVSLPRDTKVKIPGKNKSTKLNHAYGSGGPSLTIQTVENLLDISIDYYVKVNMSGFEKIISEIGDLTIDNEREFSFEGNHYPKGEITLQPEEALAYVRMRKDDPLGDMGRNNRQRKVLEASINKLVKKHDYVGMVKLLDTISKYLQWDIKQSDLHDLYTNYRPALRNIESFTLPGDGKLDKDGLWYFFAENPGEVLH